MGMLAQPVPGLPARGPTPPCVPSSPPPGGFPKKRLSLEEGYKLTDLPHAVVGEGKHPLRSTTSAKTRCRPSRTPRSMRQARSESLDLLISQDIFMTQTTALADVVLPATSWAEHEAVYTASDRSVPALRRPPLTPKGECRHDWQIFADLSGAPGLSHALRGHARNMERGARAVPPVRRRHLREDGRAGLCAVAHFRRCGRRPGKPRHARTVRRWGVHHARREAHNLAARGMARPHGTAGEALSAGAVHGARGGALLVPVDDGQLQGAGRAGRRARLREHEPGRRRRARHPGRGAGVGVIRGAARCSRAPPWTSA